MAFVDYASELLADVSELGIFRAQRIINRAYRDIRDTALWSWLLTEGVLISPAIITTGTVTTTQYNNTVALDASANAALDNLTHPLITLRQFRPNPGSLVYNITGYDPVAATLTLDRIVMEASAASTTYQVYQCYYMPADLNGDYQSDFLTWVAMKNADQGYYIPRNRLYLSQADLNGVDPQRGNQGLAYSVAYYKMGTVPGTTTPVPLFELWPAPTSNGSYPFLARRRGTDLVNPTDDIPPTLSSNLLMSRAKYRMAEWAAKNVGRFPALKGVDWRFQMSSALKEYNLELIDARRQDDEIMLQSLVDRGWSDIVVSEDLQVSAELSATSAANWAP